VVKIGFMYNDAIIIQKKNLEWIVLDWFVQSGLGVLKGEWVLMEGKWAGDDIGLMWKDLGFLTGAYTVLTLC
jgi:hypothetical protein